MDCVKMLYPQFDFVFLFDHSNGHDRLRPDGLSVTNVSKYFGGKQPRMRDSRIADRSYLGPYECPHRLNVNDVQHMNFSSEDSGPFYLTQDKRDQKRNGIITVREKEIILLKSELISLLKEQGIEEPRGTKVKLQQMCQERGLPIKKTTNNQVTEGWVGKPKGAFQILYERGWIDTTKNVTKYYTWDGRKDNFGNIIKSTSI